MKQQQPNILFFFPDQHRPDWLGCNPDLPLRTPNIDRLCERGVRFQNAYTPSPLCSPARACLATGRDYERCQVPGNGTNTPLSLPTYYRHLRDAGYEVCGVGKFDLHKADKDWGLDGSKLLDEYGFTCGIDNEGKGNAITAYRNNGMSPKGPYMQFLKERGLDPVHYGMYEPHEGKPGWLNFPAVTDLPDDAYCDNWVAENGMRFLREFAQNRPWHLVVNWVGPHGPFDVTRGMREAWQEVEFPEPHENTEPERDVILERQQNYAAMIENIDRHVGEMLRIVEERGELGNTLVVYASDHGEMLGDHNRWAKSVWYKPSAGVPLIVAGPGVQEGVVNDSPAALHDLSATFLDYANSVPLPDADVRSMRSVLEGNAEQSRDFVRSALGEWRMVFDGRYKLVLGAEDSPILYDLEEDPLESRNVAESREDLVEEMISML